MYIHIIKTFFNNLNQPVYFIKKCVIMTLTNKIYKNNLSNNETLTTKDFYV